MSIKLNLSLDVIIFLAFLFAMNPASTGLPVHEWLSIAFIATLLLHLLFHWKWIATLTRTLFQKLFHSSRLNYLVDFLFMVSMVAVMLSGILISRSFLQTLGIKLEASRSWRSIHSLSANTTLLLLGIHFALHWNWIVNSVARYILEPFGLVTKKIRSAVQPVKADNQ
jgi:hypothetical protein